MGADDLRQRLGEILLAAGIAQQALAPAKQASGLLEKWDLIETAAEQVIVIVQAAQLACVKRSERLVIMAAGRLSWVGSHGR
jgi:hypothetical protein